MSPVPALSTSPAAQINPSFPVIHQWRNPLPAGFSHLDNRTTYLHTERNTILEMHPNGPRGVEKHTDYCMLTIWVFVHILGNDNLFRGHDWAPGKGKSIPMGSGHSTKPLYHIIQGTKSGKFLCMDDESAPYHRDYTDDPIFAKHCYFNHTSNRKLRELYFREVNGTKWYLGINKNGQMRCGNVTTNPNKESRFIKKVTQLPHIESDPSYTPPKRPCCPKKKCSRTSRKRCLEKCKCAQTKNWCKKKRRQFFKLNLKELKRYYNKCIKKKNGDKRKKRHQKSKCKCARRPPCKER